MADLTTVISNIVQHDKEFAATVYQAIVAKNPYRQAGIIKSNPILNERAAGAGLVTSVPFWNPLTQNESKVPSDVKATLGEADNITQGELLARTNIRVNGWSVMDLTKIVLGDDPMTAIANRVGEWWSLDEKAMVISILKGILADDEATTDTMYVGDGTDLLSGDLVIDAAETLGDQYDALDTLIVHKKVHSLLQKAEGNAFVPKSKTDIGFDTYYGYKLIVDSGIAPASGVYTSVLISSGFFEYGEAAIDHAVAVERNERAGNFGGETTLVNRRKFLLHPAGMKQDGTPAGVSATNTELAAATMWSKGYVRENVPVAFIKSALVAS